MDRKTFIKKTAGALILAAPAIALMNCSSSSSDDSGPSGGGGGGGGGNDPNCLANGTNSSISTNHGHSLSVSSADVSAGVEKAYDINNGSGHAHIVTVSAANFNTLSSNQQIVINSTSGGTDNHTHSVTISCA